MPELKQNLQGIPQLKYTTSDIAELILKDIKSQGYEVQEPNFIDISASLDTMDGGCPIAVVDDVVVEIKEFTFGERASRKYAAKQGYNSERDLGGPGSTEGRVNPKYLCGKRIYNWWNTGGYICLILDDTHEYLWMKASDPYTIRLGTVSGENPFLTQEENEKEKKDLHERLENY